MLRLRRLRKQFAALKRRVVELVGEQDSFGLARPPLLANAEFTAWISKRTPAGRWGRLDEIGPAAVFLASDEASYVSGLVMTVDGGFTAAM